MLFDRLQIFFSPKRKPRKKRSKRRSLPAPERKVAQAWFAERTAEWAEYMEIEHGKVRVRDMTSRWGSCSGKGNLSFNIRLLSAPGDVIDYVIVHELAHCREMNHSPRFWAVVENAIPEYKELRKQLRMIGAGLLTRTGPRDFEGLGDARIPSAFEPANRLEIPVVDTPVL